MFKWCTLTLQLLFITISQVENIRVSGTVKCWSPYVTVRLVEVPIRSMFEKFLDASAAFSPIAAIADYLFPTEDDLPIPKNRVYVKLCKNSSCEVKVDDIHTNVPVYQRWNQTYEFWIDEEGVQCDSKHFLIFRRHFHTPEVVPVALCSRNYDGKEITRHKEDIVVNFDLLL